MVFYRIFYESATFLGAQLYKQNSTVYTNVEVIEMCGRFSLTASREQLESELHVQLEDYQPRYNLAPSQQVLSIVSDGVRWRTGYLRWGLVPSWAKDPRIGNKMINARVETLEEKPAFKRLLGRRRCLVVADGFYEWKKEEENKKPFRIIENNRIMTFAGLWDRWSSDGKAIVTCTIITTHPNELMSPIHDRMPAIISDEQRSTWLDPKIQDPYLLKKLLRPYPSESLTAYEVSNIVNSPKNETPGCIRWISEG